MEHLNWFKVLIIYPITSELDSNEELSDVEKIQLRNEGILEGYETDFGYYNLIEDPIRSVNPKVFLPKDNTKEMVRKNKKYFSEIVFASGDVVYAVGKPDSIYDKLNDYVDKLPVPETKSE